MILFPTAAGESFKRAAEIHLELDTKHESASNLCEAAQVLKREDPRGTYCNFFTFSCVHRLLSSFPPHRTEAVGCYLRAVEIYTDMVGHLCSLEYP